MSEKETQEHKPKFSKLAIASLIFGILGFVTFGISVIPGLILGIAALVTIKKSKGQLKGGRTATFGIVVNTILLIIFAITTPRPRRIPVDRIICGRNLKCFGYGIQVYANDNDGKYPSIDRWCDLLINNEYLTEDCFVCNKARKDGDKSRSHYAMNSDCGPNSPNDVVLLFETKGGWNQFGGPELLTAENHDGKGANILFNDYHVSFISVSDFNDLKWK